MALKGDERRLISEANLHLPAARSTRSRCSATSGGSASWERERLARAARASTDAQSRRAETADG
jgi:hypothetical protein